jgi:hypothetical protein
MTTPLDTLCARHATFTDTATTGATATTDDSEEGRGLDEDGNSGGEDDEDDDEEEIVPLAVQRLAQALNPKKCSAEKVVAAAIATRNAQHNGGAEDEEEQGVWLRVHLRTPLGGGETAFEIGMQISPDPTLMALQAKQPWVWAGAAQWLACLQLELKFEQCADLRRTWCQALEGH